MGKKDGGGFGADPLDFNWNGSVDPWEVALVAAMLEDEQEEEQDYYGDAAPLLDFEEDICEDDGWRDGCLDESEDEDWRDDCPDGSEYNIDPEDYDTLEEYCEALEEAAEQDWRDDCPDGSDYDIDPEDFDTLDEYCDALEEAEEEREERLGRQGSLLERDMEEESEEDGQEAFENSVEEDWQRKYRNEFGEYEFPNKRMEKAWEIIRDKEYIFLDSYRSELRRGEFILENSDKLIAAKYLTPDGHFLYAQAVKDNFELPVALPDEDEKSEFQFYEIINKIKRKDSKLAVKVWEWCLEQFLEYSEYTVWTVEELTTWIMSDIDPDTEFAYDVVRRMKESGEFEHRVIMEADKMTDKYYLPVFCAIKMGDKNLAEKLFTDILLKAGGDWRAINSIANALIINASYDFDSSENVRFIKEKLLPYLAKSPMGMVTDEVEEWEKRCDEEIQNMKDREEYERRIEEQKRENERRKEECAKKSEEIKKKRREEAERLKKKAAEAAKKMAAKLEADKTIYTYCGVMLQGAQRPYSYRTDDDSIRINDRVIVPVGEKQHETEGRVVYVGKYLRIGAPFPVEKTKCIIRKVSD